jgi:hypothetical protein
MRAGSEFQYTILRLVPSLERGERINVGVVLFCRQRDFLAARVDVDAGRLSSFAPDVDPAELLTLLNGLGQVAEGAPEAGVLGALPPSERFGWLAATSSTIIQPSPIHTGLAADPTTTLERLFTSLVAINT